MELALVLPLLLLMVFGVLDFSLLMYNKAVITHAAREAVRAGVALTAPKLSMDQIAGVAMQYSGSRLLSMGPAHLPVVSVSQSVDPAYQTPLAVTVSFTYQSILLSPYFSALGSPLVLSSSAMGYNE